ncbi:extracellular solute-binding protein [Microbacterium gorillae]|uniref:extracellular solute-binding protein n=1 Tax=Microbacterium gorillae TaxID=1231063 RepID=UPI000590E63E|nr:extracellular solute-binding protein [Microbacterium gorillae]
MSTRTAPWAAAGVTALAALLLTACSGAADGTEESASADFTIFAAGGYTGEYEEAQKQTIIAGYTADTGGVVSMQKGDCGLSTLEQQVSAGNVTSSLWVFCNKAELDQAITEGLVQKYDADVVPTDLVAEGHFNEYGVDFGAWNIGLAYDADAVSTPPTSIADFYDLERFPGTRCLSNYPVTAGALESALLSDGVSPDAVYPPDLPRAYAALDRIKDHILFYAGSAEGNQDLLTGQCALLMTSAGDLKLTAEENPDRDLRFVQEDGLNAYSAMAIPTGAPNPAAASAYMKSIIENRDAQSDMLSRTAVTPIVLADPLPVPADLAGWEGMISRKGYLDQNAIWYRDNYDSMLAEWNAWLLE